VPNPVCPVCNRPVNKSPQRCPHCHVVYHPNCWRQMTFCSTCSLKNPERTAAANRGKKIVRPHIKAGEAIGIEYPELVTEQASNLTLPGSALIALSIFLYLFRSESFIFIALCTFGLLMLFAGWLVRRTGTCRHVVSPSTRSIQRHVTCAGFSFSYKILGFDNVTSIRLEGERRYKGAQKGVPNYHYIVYWIVVIDDTERHIRLSSAIRTDRDPDFADGPEYEYAGLLPLAQKAGDVVGVDVYVAPQLGSYHYVTNLWKLAMLVGILVVAWLLL